MIPADGGRIRVTLRATVTEGRGSVERMGADAILKEPLNRRELLEAIDRCRTALARS